MALAARPGSFPALPPATSAYVPPVDSRPRKPAFKNLGRGLF